ncbi:MAG TPA: PHP domain-containing protein [Stenomitos sp.]
MKADLHLHTTASDGRFTPAELVEAACLVGLKAIAITDHDETCGVEAARAVVAERGYRLEVLMGIEINTVWQDAEVHVLGYFMDPATPGWQEAMQRQQGERMRRMTRFVAALQAFGVPVTLEAVQAEAGAGSLGRPHLARALVAMGVAGSEQSAFERFLTPGTPTYVPREGLTPFEAIALIRKAGGVSSLAHPKNVSLTAPTGPEDPTSLIERLVEAGLDALEIVHPSQPPMLRDYYAGMVAYYGLLSTGGTDDHGPRLGRPARIGSEAVDYAWVEALRERRAVVGGFGSLARKLL